MNRSGPAYRYLRLPLSILAAGIVLLQAGCSVFGVRNAEEASYSILDQQDQFELREYDPLVVAETVVDSDFDGAGKIAFRRLFGYISGANAATTDIAMTAPVKALENTPENGEKIAMTAPVIREQSGSGWRFSFVLPAGFTFENAPTPTNPDVRIAALPSRKVAVIRYSGGWAESSIRDNLQRLQQWMQQNQLDAASLPRVAGYDPPWTLPFLRRNEILIDVQS